MSNDFNKKNDLTFSDSWKEKSVEMMAVGAILAGAGSLAMKGNLNGTSKYMKQSFKEAGKGFESYIKKAPPVIKLPYNTAKKTFNLVAKKKPVSHEQALSSIGKGKTPDINEIPLEEIQKRSAKLLKQNKETNDYLKTKAEQQGLETPKLLTTDTYRLDAEAKASLHIEKMEAFNKKQEELKQKAFSIDESGRKGNRGATFLGGAISGLGFGAGITALHAIDKASREEKTKKRDHSFEAAGSYLRPSHSQRRDQRNMDKQANLRQFHDGIARLGKKVPDAAATGIGFTGVSLGTAALLDKKKKQEAELEAAHKKQNRIIIEFGEDELESNDPGSHVAMGRMGMVPRPQLSKQASLTNYLRNLGGRSNELNALDKKITNTDYSQLAANNLKYVDAKKVADNRFGHILSPEKAQERLLESETKKLRGIDTDRIDAIKDDVAKARVLTGGGLGLAGLSAAGVHQFNKPQKEDDLR